MKMEKLEKYNTMVNDDGIYPSELYIYNELQWCEEFLDSSIEVQEKVFNKCYDAYIGDDLSLDVVCFIAVENIEELINDDSFDFINYL